MNPASDGLAYLLLYIPINYVTDSVSPVLTFRKLSGMVWSLTPGLKVFKGGMNNN
jgi:hypothetical protein